MYFLSKHTLLESGLLQGFTDWHCHILPGVDDGVQTMDEALDILALYEKIGIKAVWLTPHIKEDVPNKTAHLKERFAELQAVYEGSVRLHLAAEYMLDNLFSERLNNSDLLPLGEKGDWLLVETSYYNPPANIFGLLERIKAKGYFPMLAHPERYMYLNGSGYEELKGRGVKFQLNLPSLAGFYEMAVRKKAQRLIKKQMYNLAGTDTHNMKMLRAYLARQVKDKIPRRLLQYS